MRVAVTGANGFVGRAVVKRLAAAGHAVRAIVRQGHVGPSAAETISVGDLAVADPAPLVAGCDAVINCAARVHVLRREAPEAALASYRSANRDMVVRLATAARAAGIETFVQMSSLAAIASTTGAGEIIDDSTPPRPGRPYGIAKREADDALLALAVPGFRVVCLRPPAVFGPAVGAWFLMLDRAAAAGMPLPVGAIANARSFIAVVNLADAVAAALAHPVSGAYLVTDSPPLSTAELYRELLRLHNRADRTWRWPAGLIRAVARVVLGGRADSLLGNAACDGSRFAEDAAWTPAIPFAAALAATIRGEPRC